MEKKMDNQINDVLTIRRVYRDAMKVLRCRFTLQGTRFPSNPYTILVPIS